MVFVFLWLNSNLSDLTSNQQKSIACPEVYFWMLLAESLIGIWFGIRATEQIMEPKKSQIVAYYLSTQKLDQTHVTFFYNNKKNKSFSKVGGTFQTILWAKAYWFMLLY